VSPRLRVLLSPILLLALLLASGCISKQRTPYASSLPPAPRPAARTAEYPQKLHITPRLERDKPWTSHYVWNLFRPEPCGYKQGDHPSAIAYVSKTPGRKRWIVVLPIWGSSTYPSRKIAHELLSGDQEDGTNVLWVQDGGNLQDYEAMKKTATEEEFLQEVSHTSQCIDANTEDARAWVEWILKQPPTDPERIGIVGFSVSAMVASLAMGRDPRIKAGVFVMGGGHWHQVLASCSGEEKEIREHVMKKFGWNVEQFTQVIEGPLSPVDPVAVAGNIDPTKVLYIDAGKDTCIPASAREDLWEALGRPERITVGYAHKRSFLSMTVLGLDTTTRAIVRFFDQRIPAPTGRKK
jgi:dienelactone hydrolase